MADNAKHLVVGVLAHVDSGKTTLSEALLYRAGAIRKLGRVDHRDAFLDTDSLEKARGITIFSKQALFTAGQSQIAWLDTPGHVDFSAEAERTVQVLDYAVLVISGPDGVQSHTETLWNLLRQNRVPTFLFVNKMDLPGPGREEVLTQLRRRLGEGFVDFGQPPAARDEALAGMGTTAVCALVRSGRIHLCHAGDSRAYLYHAGRLIQLTHDHSYVQELVDCGTITPQEAEHHPQKNIITRALGVDYRLCPDYTSVVMLPGDLLLLCSDGLTNFVPAAEMEKILGQSSFYDAPDRLVEAANAGGGQDNITALLLGAEPLEVKHG